MDLAPTPHTADLRKITSDQIKRLLRSLAQHLSDADLKDCIMTAREHGHLTDEECGWFITYWGLKNA